MEKAIAYIKNNRENLELIKGKVLEFASENTPMNLRNFFVRCTKLNLPATSLAYYTMAWLAENGRTDVIDALFSSTTTENVFYGVYCIGKAFSDFRNYDVKSGGEHLREGLYQSLTVNFKNIPDQDLLLRNAFLLEDIEWPGEEIFAKPLFEVVYDNCFADSPYTCCVTCDAVHFEQCFEIFSRDLRVRCGDVNIFVLIVNSTEDTLSSTRQYSGITVATTEYDGRWLAEFCDLAPFMLATEILDRIGGPVIFTRMDVVLPDDVGCVLSEITKSEVTLFDTGDTLPTNMIGTKLVASRLDGETIRFWRMVENLVLRGFARQGPLLGLGEMALLAAASELKAGGGSVGIWSDPCVAVKKLESEPETETTNHYYRAKSITPEQRVAIAEQEQRQKEVSRDSRYKNIALPWDLSDDTEKLVKFIGNNTGQGDRIISEILNFSDKANAEVLNNLFMEFRQIPGIRPADLAYHALRMMVEQGKGDKVSSVFDASNENNPFFGLYSIGQSFRDCMNWQIEDCAHNMREGLYYCLTNKVNFSDLGFVMQNAYLMETVTWPESARPVLPNPLFRVVFNHFFDKSSDAASYTLITGVSNEYVKKYIVETITNIRENCNLPNVNVIVLCIHPDADVINILQAIDGVMLIEWFHGCEETAPMEVKVGTSSQVVMQEIAKMTKNPLIFIELDSCYPKEMKAVFEYMANCKTPLIVDTGIVFPTLKLDSAVMCFDVSNEANNLFVSLNHDYMGEIIAKGGPIYLYDQVCRYRAACVCMRKGVQLEDLNHYLHNRWRDFFKADVSTIKSKSLKMKWEERSNTRYTFQGISRDKRLIYVCND